MSSFFSPYRHEFIRDRGLRAAGCRCRAPPECRRRRSAARRRRRSTCRADGVPGTRPVGLCNRRSVVSGRLARRGRRRNRPPRRGQPQAVPGLCRRRAVARGGHLYNCGLVVHRGQLLGVVPKVYLPNYREFYERRHFTSGEGVRRPDDHGRRPRGAVWHRSVVRCDGRGRVHLSCRDLRRFVGAAAAEQRRRSRRRRNPAEPVGQQHHDRQGANARACYARRNRRAASPPTLIPPPAPANRRPTSPGTARPASSNWARLWPKPSAFRPIPKWRSPMSMSAGSARSGCA